MPIYIVLPSNFSFLFKFYYYNRIPQHLKIKATVWLFFQLKIHQHQHQQLSNYFRKFLVKYLPLYCLSNCNRFLALIVSMLNWDRNRLDANNSYDVNDACYVLYEPYVRYLAEYLNSFGLMLFVAAPLLCVITRKKKNFI